MKAQLLRTDEQANHALDMGEDERAADGTADAEDEPPAGAATGGATSANTVDSSRIDIVVDGWMHPLNSLTGYLCAKGQALIADFLPNYDAQPAKSTFVDPALPSLGFFVGPVSTGWTRSKQEKL
jgi:hypothetical protein